MEGRTFLTDGAWPLEAPNAPYEWGVTEARRKWRAANLCSKDFGRRAQLFFLADLEFVSLS